MGIGFILFTIITVMLIAGIAMVNTLILQDRNIWLKNNTPAVKMSFNTFQYLYIIDPSNYQLRLTVATTAIPSGEIVNEDEKTISTEYCPILFNQLDTVRFILWNKYRRPKETYDLATSVRYAKILSKQLLLIETLTKVSKEQ